MRGVSLTYPLLASIFCGKFLLHIPCLLHFCAGSFSYTSHTGFIFIWGVSLTYTMLGCSGEFLLDIPRWLYFLSWELFLHITCWLHISVGSFSYKCRAGFIFIWGVSLTHPVLASFLCGEFLIHIPCCPTKVVKKIVKYI